MEFDARFEAYFENELSPEEMAEFRAWLCSDPEHAREFARYAHLHQALRSELKGRTVRRVERSVAMENQEIAPRSWHGWWAAAAAVLIVVVLLIHRGASIDPGLAVFQVKVESISGKGYLTDKSGAMRNPAQKDSYLSRNGGLEFEGPGQAVLKYLDGTTLDYTSTGNQRLALRRSIDMPNINPAQEGKRVSIDTGKLNVYAAKQGEETPMVLCTPLAEVTVVGTTFSLDWRYLKRCNQFFI